MPTKTRVRPTSRRPRPRRKSDTVYSPRGGRPYVVRNMNEPGASLPKTKDEMVKALLPFVQTLIQSLAYLSVLLRRWTGVEIDTTSLEHYLDDSIPEEMKKDFARQLAGASDGREVLGGLKTSHVRSIAKAIRVYYREIQEQKKKSAHIVLIGSPQLGKTRVFTALYFLLPVIMHVVTKGKMKIDPVLSSPPNSAAIEQIKMEMQAAFLVLGKVVIRSATTSIEISVSDYFEDIIGRKARSSSDYERSKHWNDMLCMRNHHKIEPFKRFIKASKDKGFTPLLFNDECHHGSKKNSVLDRKTAAFNGSLGQIAISATPAELTSEKTLYDWQPVKIWVDKTYIGPRHWNGYKLPAMPGYKERLPDCHNIETFMLQSGFSQDEANVIISPEAFVGPGAFAKVFNYHGRRRQAWLDHRMEFAKIVYKIFDQLINVTKNRQLMCGRFLPTNAANDALIDLLMEIDPNLEIIKFYDTQPEKRTIKDLTYSALDEHKRALVLVTNRARMADSFPRECGVFVDLTKKGSNHTSVLQGTFGRACGHNKDSLVLLRKKLLDELEEFLRWDSRALNPKNKHEVSKKAMHYRTTLYGQRGRPAENFDLRLDLHACPAINKVFAAINRSINRRDENGEFIFQSRTATTFPVPKTNRRFWADSEVRDILSNEFLAELPLCLPEGYEDFEFLKWGEEDKFKQNYYMALCDQGLPIGRNGIIEKLIGHAGVIGRQWLWDIQAINSVYDGARRGRRPVRDDRNRIEPQLMATLVSIKCGICKRDTRDVLLTAREDGNGDNAKNHKCCLRYCKAELLAITLRKTGTFRKRPKGRDLQVKVGDNGSMYQEREGS